MFKDDFADMCAKNSAGVDGGPSGGASVRRPVSGDPHRRQRNYIIKLKTFFGYMGDKKLHRKNVKLR